MDLIREEIDLANPNTIPWLHYQDIQVSDVSLKEQFDKYIENANYIEALQLLKDNQQKLQGKAYVSDTITKIISGILYLQEQYNAGVSVFLSDLALKHRGIIDSIVQMNVWQSNRQYGPYNFVVYDNKVYMAIDLVPIGESPMNTKFWLELGLRGNKGAPGLDIKIKFIWNAQRQYRRMDVVVYGDNMYVALKSNMDVVPGTDETTWLTFIIVSQESIAIGPTPPERATNSTIWFKTDVDPLATDAVTPGQFCKYETKINDWDPMYPATLVNLVSGTEKYSIKAIFIELNIDVADWGKLNEYWIYEFTNIKVPVAKFVEILYGDILSEEQFNLYSSIEVSVSDNRVTIKTKSKPIVNLPLIVIIQ